MHVYLSFDRVENRIVNHINILSILTDASGIDNRESAPINLKLMMRMSDDIVTPDFNCCISIDSSPLYRMGTFKSTNVGVLGEACDQIRT